MSTLVIKDLPEDIELDRAAMRAIVGGKAGARLGLPQSPSLLFPEPLRLDDQRLLPSLFGGHDRGYA